jgi:hypothetical protein
MRVCLSLRERLGRRPNLADLNVAIYTAAFVELDATGTDLAFHEAGSLKLEPAFHYDGAGYPSTDDRILRQDVTLHHPVFADHHGLRRPYRPFDNPLDAKGAIGFAVADDAHPGPNYGDDVIPGRLSAVRFLRHFYAVL